MLKRIGIGILFAALAATSVFAAAGGLNPRDNAHSTSTRPVETNSGAATRKWFSDANRTAIYAQDLNRMMAQLRSLWDFYGITDAEGDDTLTRQAVQAAITGMQPLDTDLTALAGLSTSGLIARTGSGTATTRTITGPAAGLLITNGNGVAGNPDIALANDLAALEALSCTNSCIPKRTGVDTWGTVTIGTDIQAWDADLAALAALSATGVAHRTGAGTWSAAPVSLTADVSGLLPAGNLNFGDGLQANGSAVEGTFCCSKFTAVLGSTLSAASIVCGTAYEGSTVDIAATLPATPTNGCALSFAPGRNHYLTLDFNGKSLRGDGTGLHDVVWWPLYSAKSHTAAVLQYVGSYWNLAYCDPLLCYSSRETNGPMQANGQALLTLDPVNSRIALTRYKGPGWFAMDDYPQRLTADGLYMPYSAAVVGTSYIYLGTTEAVSVSNVTNSGGFALLTVGGVGGAATGARIDLDIHSVLGATYVNGFQEGLVISPTTVLLPLVPYDAGKVYVASSGLARLKFLYASATGYISGPDGAEVENTGGSPPYGTLVGKCVVAAGPTVTSCQSWYNGPDIVTGAIRSDGAGWFSQAGAGDLSNGVTGSGAIALATSPAFTTPTLGIATATSINKVALTPPATGATLTIADGKTLTVNNTLTLAGTDSSTLNIGAGGTLGSNAFTSTAYAPLASPTFTGIVTTPQLAVDGDFSAPDWANLGVRLRVQAATITNTTSTGTEASLVMNRFASDTIAASSVTTFTNAYTLRVAPPTAGANVTITNAWALQLNGNVDMNANSIQNLATLQGSGLNSPAVLGGTTATQSVPTLIPNRASTTTGIGGASTQMDFIASSTDMMRITNGHAYAIGFASAAATKTGYICYDGTTSPANELIRDTVSCLSSLEELKDIHGPIDGGVALSDVMKLRPFWFKWNQARHATDDTYEQPGLGAHATERVDPRLVYYDPHGNLEGVRYDEMTALLVATVQYQQGEIDMLKRRLH